VTPALTTDTAALSPSGGRLYGLFLADFFK